MTETDQKDEPASIQTKTLDSKQAAAYLRCSDSRISELVACGQLRACRIGRGFVFKPEWLDLFLDEESARQMAALEAARIPDPTPPTAAGGGRTPSRGERTSRKRTPPDLSGYA